MFSFFCFVRIFIMFFYGCEEFKFSVFLCMRKYNFILFIGEKVICLYFNSIFYFD